MRNWLRLDRSCTHATAYRAARFLAVAVLLAGAASAADIYARGTNLATAPAATTFDSVSKSNPGTYRQKVDFDVVCAVTGAAPDDPIVFPGRPGASHRHVFTGNLTTDANSTTTSLDAGGTNCMLDQDRAAYWMPSLYTGGVEVTPYFMRAYYRAGSLNPVAHTPHGLEMVAGNSTATVPQDQAVAGWQCRGVSPDVQTVPKQATIPTCASTDLLEGSVVFPNCWDGVHLDSADHKSHMSYSWADGNPDNCDAAHPIQIAQLTVAYRYEPGTTNSQSYLASMNSGLTLHADFWNAWDQPTLDMLVDRCINAGIHCGDVSPSHFPNAPSISVGDVAVVEGNAGARALSFPVTLSVPATARVSVRFVASAVTASGGSAAGSGTDFKTASGTVAFTPSLKTGLTPVERFVSIVVYGDVASESNETFNVTLSPPVGGSYSLRKAVGTGTILNDDPHTGQTAGVGDATIVEGATGTRTIRVPVTLSGAPGTSTVTVPYMIAAASATWAKTAASGADFGGATSGKLTFTGSAVTRAISIVVYGDTAAESNEILRVTLGTPTGASAARVVGTVTIINDD